MEKIFFVRNVYCCFPYGVSQRIPSGKLGVLDKYCGVDLDEQQADDFVCKLIKKHPYIEDATSIQVNVEWRYTECQNTTGIYHVITIENENRGTENREYKLSPICWR